MSAPIRGFWILFLTHIDFRDEVIQQVSARPRMRCALLLMQLTSWTVPGVGRRSDEVLLAEFGIDISRLPRAG